MMTAMLTQPPLPWLPEGAVEIAPGVGLVAGPDGGVVWGARDGRVRLGRGG